MGPRCQEGSRGRLLATSPGHSLVVRCLRFLFRQLAFQFRCYPTKGANGRDGHVSLSLGPSVRFEVLRGGSPRERAPRGRRGEWPQRETGEGREKELPPGGYSRVSSSAQCHKHRGSAASSSVGRVIASGSARPVHGDTAGSGSSRLAGQAPPRGKPVCMDDAPILTDAERIGRLRRVQDVQVRGKSRSRFGHVSGEVKRGKRVYANCIIINRISSVQR